MASWLFPRFLNDAASYQEAEAFWRERWAAILQRAGSGAAWETPWQTNPDRDGNPIFSAVCPSLRRGVRIVQEEPAEDAVALDWWEDTFGSEAEPIRELVIACVPSRENLAEIEQLLLRWVVDGTVRPVSPHHSALPEVHAPTDRV